MKREPWPSRCALLLMAITMVLPLRAMDADPQNDMSTYQRFLTYPHRQRGFAAMRAGDENTAMAEFKRARELAPRSVETALDLAEAYRHFGHPSLGREVLLEQRRFTPQSARLHQAEQALAKAKPIPDCNLDNSFVCRAKRGYDDLAGGDLAKAQAELDAADFARSREGIALRHALAQRAIYLGDAKRAETQFAALDSAGLLHAEERGQWFALLLERRQLDAARELQARGGLDTPQQQLALAHAMADQGDLRALAVYMDKHHPVFGETSQEQQWLYLLARASHVRPDLLTSYRPSYPDNRELYARLMLPLAMARGDDATARRMLSQLPGGSFRDTRFSLALQAGQFAEAQRQASAMLAAANGAQLLDPLSYRLMEAGARNEARQLLLAAYPFADNGHAEALLARLALLARAQPSLFTAADRARLRRPLGSVALRSAQVPVLTALGDCEGVRQVLGDLSPEYPADRWRALGDCYRKDHPGLAEYAYAQARQRDPDAYNTRALAYQAYATQDYARALQAWRELPAGHLKTDDLKAAATTALALGERSAAGAWLDSYVAQGGSTGDEYWWLRAQVDADRDPAAARVDLQNAIAARPDPRYYARLAALQGEAGEPQQAAASLEHAVSLAPGDPKLAATLGYTYLKLGAVDKAAVQFERAHRANPEDPVLTRQLLYVQQRLGHNEEARSYAALAIDQLGMGGNEEGQAVTGVDEQRFRLRRLHEDLGRRWRFLGDLSLGDSVSSGANAIAPGVSYRSYLQFEAQYRFDPELTGGDINTLAAYGRVFAGSGPNGSVWPVHTPKLGVGLHWKPLREYMVVLSAEEQVPLDNSVGNRSDTMLRASASWSGSPRLSDDWHPVGRGWFAQNLYLDAAHYFRSSQTALTVDYRFGYHRKLVDAQTVGPYARVQFNGLDRAHGAGFGRDVRAGVGVSWDLWYGETRYDAFRHRFSASLEWQHAFTSYLHETNAVFLTLGGQW